MVLVGAEKVFETFFVDLNEKKVKGSGFLKPRNERKKKKTCSDSISFCNFLPLFVSLVSDI